MKEQRRTGSSRDFRSSTINCPLTPSNPFRITYIRKNAPANPYGSHIYKTKDLKSFESHICKKRVGGGVRAIGARRERGGPTEFRIPRFEFRLSTFDSQLSTVNSLP